MEERNGSTENRAPDRSGVEPIALGDVPDEVLKSSQQDIADYTVGLIAVEPENRGGHFEFVGCATLVRAFGIHGLLTAAHVVRDRRFRDAATIGMTLVPSVNGYQIDQSRLEECVTHYSESAGDGPDIAFVRLADADAGTIDAYKSFWDLECHAVLLDDSTVGPDIGTWALIGGLGERVHAIEPSPDFQRPIVIPGSVYFSLVTEYWEESGFDYYRWLTHAPSDPEAPKSFGGYSGGGLWQVPLRKQNDGTIVPERARLAGCAFCEQNSDSGMRVIVCHGQKTIYRDVLRGIGKLV